ncbi:MAG: hypothetical protein QM504_13985 [Pseudomonadota bacterium]
MVRLTSAFYYVAVSWFLIAIGVYVYEYYGLALSFIPFALSAMIRKNINTQAIDNIYKNVMFKIVSVIYYFGLLVVVIFDTEVIAAQSTIAFVFIIGFPVLIAIMYSDLKNTFEA